MVPGDTSGATNDCNVNNPETDVEFLRAAHRLIERNESGTAEDCNEINQHQDLKTKDTPPRLVERATALRGLSICSKKDSKSTCRKRTEQDLHSPYAEVPYVKTELAIRALVCSLMERQDRMNEEIFLKINDLKYRFDDLELSKKSRATKQPGFKREVCK